MKPHLFAAVVVASLLSMGADKVPPYQQWRKLFEAAPADVRGPDKGKWTEAHRKALEDWLLKTHLKQTVRIDGHAAAIAMDPVPTVEAVPPPFTMYGYQFKGYVSYTFKPESRDQIVELKNRGPHRSRREGRRHQPQAARHDEAGHRPDASTQGMHGPTEAK